MIWTGKDSTHSNLRHLCGVSKLISTAFTKEDVATGLIF